MTGDAITYVGHATVLIEVDGTRLLTDPVLVSRIGHIRRIAPPAPTDLRTDAILVCPSNPVVSIGTLLASVRSLTVS